MKKLLALLLALVMVLSLTACGEETTGSSGKKRRKASSDETETIETVSETEEEVAEEAEEELEEEAEETELVEEEEVEETNNQWMSAYTVYEQLGVTVIDEDGFTMTFGELKKGSYCVEMPVEMKNTSKYAVSSSVLGAAVNGKVTSLYMGGSTESGKTDSEAVKFYDCQDPADITRVSLLISTRAESLDSTEYLIDIYPQGVAAYKASTPKAKGQDVMVNEDGVFVAIQSYKESRDEFSFDYLMINSSQETVDINMNPVALNGLGVTAYVSKYVLPGTYAQDSAKFDEYKYLSALGMGKITSMTLDVDILDTDYHSKYKEQVNVYPGGKKNDDVFVYTPNSDAQVILDTDDVKMTFVQATEEEYTGTVLLFAIENKTTGFVNVEATDMKVNGKPFDSGWIYRSAYDGRDTYEVFTVYEFRMDELGITEVTSLEMLLTVKDNNYKTAHEETVELTIN